MALPFTVLSTLGVIDWVQKEGEELNELEDERGESWKGLHG